MMATLTSAPTSTTTTPRVSPTLIAFGGVTTYYYRTSDGTRGNTNDLGSLPAGTVIERTTTT